MCLVLFSYRTVPGYPLIVAANRDEFHGRASSAADFWADNKQILGGRDLVADGTWLGCTRNGRFAALTNFSSPDDPAAPRSRGHLVEGFLSGSDSAEHYAHQIKGSEFAGFNLLLFDGEQLVYTSNRAPTEVLSPGCYGLSNAELGARWPKCTQGAARLDAITSRAHDVDELVDLLADRNVPDDRDLPHRGRPIEMERRVAPSFIIGDEYGTRASTVVHVGDRRCRFVEQSFAAAGVPTGRVEYEYEFAAD